MGKSKTVQFTYINYHCSFIFSSNKFENTFYPELSKVLKMVLSFLVNENPLNARKDF